jgi:hypothetical protein
VYGGGGGGGGDAYIDTDAAVAGDEDEKRTMVMPITMDFVFFHRRLSAIINALFSLSAN